MSSIDTISEFLLHAGTDYRVFDMARGIRPVDSQVFLEIENSTIAAPYPRQQHAWFGILFFNKNTSKEQYIWFVKLPLDEQGLVISAGRRQFLEIVVEALGQQLDKENNPNNQLPENPFTFIPNQNQLADFNAKCRLSLDLGVSKHLEHVTRYLQAPEQHDWRTLSIQGIADFCAQIPQAEHQDLLMANFSQLATEMQTALCTSFENHVIPEKISHLLIDWATINPNLAKIQSALRALSQAGNKAAVQAFIHQLLNNSMMPEPNILMLIGARHWHVLNESELLSLFINHLAECDHELFVGLYSDLVQIPEIRDSLLGVLRWPEKSHNLTQAIGVLFGQNQ